MLANGMQAFLYVVTLYIPIQWLIVPSATCAPTINYVFFVLHVMPPMTSYHFGYIPHVPKLLSSIGRFNAVEWERAVGLFV